MLNMAYRNIKLFFRDKSSVFFSFLSVLIIIGLYVLFLGDMLEMDMQEYAGARFLMDSWIMAGVVTVTTVTSTTGAFGIMVDDKDKNIYKDFYVSPVKRYKLAGGYLISAFFVALIMSLLTLVLAELYILSNGGALLSFSAFVQVLGLIVLSVVSSSSFVFFIVSFFRSNTAFGIFSTILGTFIGFLTGIYIPIGNLPAAVQTAIKLFPTSHAAVLFRQVMTQAPLEATFALAPAEAIAAFQEAMGIHFSYGGSTATAGLHISVLLLTAVIFFGLAVLNLSRKKR